METTANLGLKTLVMIDWNDRWTEEDTIFLIETVQKIHDAVPVTIEDIEDGRAWTQIAGRLGKNNAKFPEACKRKFVELWVTYELVVNHGCPMPTSFTDRVFEKMTHYSEGDGPIDAEKPRRRVPVESIRECVDNENLLTLLGIDITYPNTLFEGATSEGSELSEKKSKTDDVPDHKELPETTPPTPKPCRRRRSERLRKRRLPPIQTSSSEEGQSGEEQTEGRHYLARTSRRPLQSVSKVPNKRTSLRLAERLGFQNT